MKKLAAVLSLSSVVSACAGMEMTPQTPLKATNQTSKATLVVGEITRPRDLVTNAGNPFYAAMQRVMPQELEQAHVAQTVVSERDLNAAGVKGPAYVVRYRVIEDQVTIASTGGLCVGLLTGFGVLTIVPLAFLGMCTAKADHNMSVEARVFQADDAAVTRVQDSSSNEMVNVVDTSAMTPLLRREYKVSIHVENGVFHHPQGAEQAEMVNDEAREAVRQVLASSIEDLSRTMTQHTASN
jgi:hypothetical protein